MLPTTSTRAMTKSLKVSHWLSKTGFHWAMRTTIILNHHCLFKRPWLLALSGVKMSSKHETVFKDPSPLQAWKANKFSASRLIESWILTVLEFPWDFHGEISQSPRNSRPYKGIFATHDPSKKAEKSVRSAISCRVLRGTGVWAP